MNPVKRILGDRVSRNRDEAVREVEIEEQYDLFDPNRKTPQVCTRCGERIKLKDIHFVNKTGDYKHKTCAYADLKEKYANRRK